jgi:hypothetical protein
MKRMSASILTVMLLAALAVPDAVATTWHVPGDFGTIQGAIDAAGEGDEVLIAYGIYPEHDILLKYGVAVLGEEGGAYPVIDAQGAGRVLRGYDLGSSTEIARLVLTGGVATGGDPVTGGGGGIYLRGSSPTVHDCWIVDNEASYGGGVYCHEGSSPDIVDCRLQGNVSHSYGGGLYCHVLSSPDVSGTTFSGNAADVAGGAVYCVTSSSPVLERCSLVENSSGLMAVDASRPEFYLCLIAHSTGGSAMVYEAASQPWFDCCDVFGNAGGDWTGPAAAQLGVRGNIALDPQLCSSRPDLDGNWTLQSDSPCLAANNGCGETIGAWGIGCSTVGTRQATWGGVKALYR